MSTYFSIPLRPAPLSRDRNFGMMMPLAREGWGEGMSRMVIDDEMLWEFHSYNPE